ncbi:MAG TPA: hypothetical protein VHE08_07990 [Solirubrobacterales bacterium]|nr:hypothetical protein [Solirubrobacterales bacterium]
MRRRTSTSRVVRLRGARRLPARVVAVGVSLALVAAFLAAPAALAAEKQITLAIHWEGVPDGTRVSFSDVGGNCDTKKRLYSYELGRDNPVFLRLFKSKDSGSCAFDATNARFRIHITTPDTAQSSQVILIAQARAGGDFGAYCDTSHGVTCRGGGEISASTLDAMVQMWIGPVTAPAGPAEAGYRFCGAETHYCPVTYGETVAYGAGAGPHGRYVYKKVEEVNARRIVCGGEWFGGQDPVPGERKACFVKPA